ncbi:MAG TPA: class I SAM-dependent methyltransferase [Terriglobales bacterium]|jgi:hypothetical protein|nr:class I SAM-dependent methyltransferase [Terriglobales bacterium]
MDLRVYSLTPEQIERATHLFDYQPYILSDDIQTGIAYDFLYAAEDPNRYLANRRLVSKSTWERFVAANAQLRQMYDDWIDQMSSLCGTESSVADIACNTGYFLHRFALKGHRKTVGYDRLDTSEAIQFINKLVGTSVEFIHQSYDSWTHKIPGCAQHDIVIASAIMLHLSDPLYFLHFLGSITKKCLFLFTLVNDSPDHIIHYITANKFYKDDFPLCFDNHSISFPLLTLGLQRMGFTTILEIPHRQSWLPSHWYNQYKMLLCFKH